MILDQAEWHGAGDLRVLDTITQVPLPAYSPELNPASASDSTSRSFRIGWIPIAMPSSTLEAVSMKTPTILCPPRFAKAQVALLRLVGMVVDADP